MVADGLRIDCTRSRRPNLSPAAYRGGPTLASFASRLWHLAQASLVSLEKSALPRATSPVWAIAKDSYCDVVGCVFGAEGFACWAAAGRHIQQRRIETASTGRIRPFPSQVSSRSSAAR